MPDKGGNGNGSKKSPKVVTDKSIDLGRLKKLIPNFSKIKELNRNAVLAAVLATVLLFVGMFAFVFNKSTEPTEPATIAQNDVVEIAEPLVNMDASITLVEGITEYKADELWEPASEEMKIEPGMYVRTVGAASRATVSFEDGSIIRLDANSEVQFQTITPSRIVVLQEEGHTYSRVAENDERSYVVETENSSVFEALGTAFKTTSTGDEDSVEVYEGTVRESTINIRAFDGEKLVAKDFRNPSNDGTVESLDIEDVKKDEFVIWNREQDLANEAFSSKLGFLSDVDGPEISISSPKLGSTIELESNASEGTVQIEGTTERGVSLKVESKSVSNSENVDVAVTNDGTFKTPVLKTAIGNSVFQFTATDRSGNETKLSVSFVFRTKSTVQEQGIALSLDDTTTPGSLIFSWGLVGITTPDGVKLVYAEEEDPTHPDNQLDYIETEATRIIPVSDPPFESGKTYNFHVCRYSAENDSCDIYSNQVSVEIP